MVTTQTFAGLELERVPGGVLCPHGMVIPLDNGTPAKVGRFKTRGRWGRREWAHRSGYCDVCEAQRAAGREQDEEIRALLKSLGRPKYNPKSGVAPKARRKAASVTKLRAKVKAARDAGALVDISDGEISYTKVAA